MALIVVTALGAGVAAALQASAVPQSASGRPDAARSARVAFATSRTSATRTPKGEPPLADRARPHAFTVTGTPPAPGRQIGGDNEENSNPTSTKPMTYRGAAVQSAPRIHLVFWGPTWFTNGDPDGVANRLHYFYQGLGGSSWANLLKQYGSNYGTFTNPTGQYVGWTQDKTPVPAQPTSTDIRNAALRAEQLSGDYSYNAQYIIALPYGVVDQYTLSQKACAWHSWTYAGPSGNWITYTSMPYTPYLDARYAPNTYCGGGGVNGTAGILDGVTINAAHEYGETVNDPTIASWKDSDNSEIADKCSWRNLANRPFVNGYSFPVQPLWSNAWRTTYKNGCLYS